MSPRDTSSRRFRLRFVRAARVLVLLAGAWAALGVRPAAAAPPRLADIEVVDVTPTSFTVIWTADAASSAGLDVFSDVLATQPVGAAVRIDTRPLLGGDPAVATDAESLGVLRVRVSELAPGTAYFFRTRTTPTAGGATALVPASGALPSAVTQRESAAASANGVGAEVHAAGGMTPRRGALLVVSVPGRSHPLSALAGDGYGGGLAAVDLANLYAPSGLQSAPQGGETASLRVLGGTAGAAATNASLAANGGAGLLQILASPLVLAAQTDSDGDGMTNAYEIANGFNPGLASDAALDADADGLSNLQESQRGTNPRAADSDGDGLSDGFEVSTSGTLPTVADTDRDGRSDGAERNGPIVTNPLDADSDDDLVSDGEEIAAGTNPNSAASVPQIDRDLDLVVDRLDNCPTVPNPSQLDSDGDGAGNACDGDDDGDAIADGPDNCPSVSNASQTDGDGDGVGDPCDVCPAFADADQADNDVDGLGDVCDPDDDNDGVADLRTPAPPANAPFTLTSVTSVSSDALPVTSNGSAFVSVQKLLLGPARLVRLGYFDLKLRTFTLTPPSGPDATAPGWLALGMDVNRCGCFDVAQGTPFTVTADTGVVTAALPADAQALTNALIVATDGSTYAGYQLPSGPLTTLLQSAQVAGPLDNCRLAANPDQADQDGDGAGDVCDVTPEDLDGDGVLNADDNCPLSHNPTQLDLDADALGDVCDTDDDGDGVPDAIESGVTVTDPRNADTDGDGLSDGAEDFDFDGISNAVEAAAGSSPVVPDVTLEKGLNLFSYPVGVPAGFSAFDLLALLGGPTAVESVGRLVPATQQLETAGYAASTPIGVDFPVLGAEGYFVEMKLRRSLSIPGTPSCPTHVLAAGVNAIGFPCAPNGFTQRSLLQHFGGESVVASVAGLDGPSGRFDLTGWLLGAPAGANVPVVAGRGLLVQARAPTGSVAPPIAAPNVQILSPASGATVTTSPVTVTGSVSDPSASVIVNGVVASVAPNGSFSASVPLADGPRTIQVVARSRDELAASASVSITVATVAPPDFSVRRGATAGGSRSFNVGAGTLTGLAYFTTTESGLPAGVSFSPGSIQFFPTTGDVTAPFDLTATAGATLGRATVQVIYRFFNSADVELTSRTLSFTVEVTP